LRGRDIKRYGYDWAGLWLIATFPSKKYDIEKLPAIKNHLLSFGKERLEQTGKTYHINGETIKARKKTNNKWFETQDSISYWDDFYKPKIVYPDIAQKLSFVSDEKGYILGNTAYFFTCKDRDAMQFLLKVLNSKLIDWYYRTLSVQLGEKAVRMFSIYVLKIPIIQSVKDLPTTETEIDCQVYQLYGLDKDEMTFIETYSL